MPRNRVIYQSLALYASQTTGVSGFAAAQTGAGSVLQLHRIQSFNYSFNIPRENINQYGKLAAIERKNVEPPTVSADFSYYLVDMVNEQRLGFTINNNLSALGGILTKNTDQKNYYLAIANEGVDAGAAAAADVDVVGIGNAFISSYSVEGAVGGFATGNVSIEGLNIRGYDTGVAQDLPAVDPTTGEDVAGSFTVPSGTDGIEGMASAISQGDITISVTNPNNLFEQISGACAQSFNISYDLSREAINCLGSKFSKSREITFPVDVTCTLEFLKGDLTTGALNTLLCGQDGTEIEVRLKEPLCGTGTPRVVAAWKVLNAQLDSQNMSSSIGPNKTISITWVGQIAGSNDSTNGIQMSGVTGYLSGSGHLVGGSVVWPS